MILLSNPHCFNLLPDLFQNTPAPLKVIVAAMPNMLYRGGVYRIKHDDMAAQLWQVPVQIDHNRFESPLEQMNSTTRLTMVEALGKTPSSCRAERQVVLAHSH